MQTVCEKNQCSGCMACVASCSQNAIQIKDSLDAYNAVINEEICIRCGKCYRLCPNNNPLNKKLPIQWYEGWAKEEIRANSSSGGAASAIMYSFIKQGGYVASCVFEKGQFCFDVTNKAEDIYKFAGSKYVKSNPENVYAKIRKLLYDNEKVLFLGLPCQIAGLKKYLKGNIENLYTVDLVCHGSPSPGIISMFLKEKNIDINQVKDISFRKKEIFDIATQKANGGFIDISPSGVQDMYSYAFLGSLDYTENCYSCSYATLGRVSDITLGDSWGSGLSNMEKRKGISLILCQTEKGYEMVKTSKLILHEVDLEKAIQANHQLKHPSIMPSQRAVFFKNLNKGFEKAIAKCSPKTYYKKKLKLLLVRSMFRNLFLGGRCEVIEYNIRYKLYSYND